MGLGLGAGALDGYVAVAAEIDAGGWLEVDHRALDDRVGGAAEADLAGDDGSGDRGRAEGGGAAELDAEVLGQNEGAAHVLETREARVAVGEGGDTVGLNGP